MNGWQFFVNSWLPAAKAHLATSTVFLLLAVILSAAMRNRLTAAARFAIVFIGIAKFAVPAALLSPLVARLLPQPSDGAAGAVNASLALLADAVRFEQPSASVAGWSAAAAAVWLVVAVLLVARSVVARHRLTSLSLRTAVPPTPREVAALERARRRVNVRRSIDLVRSALPEAPAVLRVFRPVVVLPMHTCDELTDEELESLLCHECAHVRRHDNLAARFEGLVGAVFWFHPLLWIAQRINGIERERACDEAVAASPEEGERYRLALARFCHALIVPRQPGISCMATAKLKERIEHVMNYPRLKAQSPPAARVAAAAIAALVIFTLFSAISGTHSLLASTKNDAHYSIRIDAEQSGDSVILQGRVTDNATQTAIAAPRFTFPSGQPARATVAASGRDITFDVRPSTSRRVEVEVTIRRGDELEQRATIQIIPAMVDAQPTPNRYSGAPISLRLTNAEIRDLLRTFGQLADLDIRPDPDIAGIVVSVNWVDVPWDQAFESILEEHGLKYTIDGSVIHVSKK